MNLSLDENLCRWLHDLLQVGENLTADNVIVVVEYPLEEEHVRICQFLQLLALQNNCRPQF